MSTPTIFNPSAPLSTAVLFLVFNRTDVTKQVFEAIRQAKPPRLYIASDGARDNKSGEAEKVAEVRRIVTFVDWPCEVKTLFQDKNLGCKMGVSTGINWFFEHEEMGIILEDDCLPDPSFFRFCEELLIRYRDDERIAMISGDNFQFGRKRGDSSYYFSRYNHIWGWASWRRAWQHYDVKAKSWPEMHEGKWLKTIINDSIEQRYWTKVMQAVYEGQIDTWDYQWGLACWCQGMISIMPQVNLISNIGFGSDATHTQSENIYSALSVESITFPLDHPKIILPHSEADAFTAKEMFSMSQISRIWKKIKFLIKKS